MALAQKERLIKKYQDMQQEVIDNFSDYPEDRFSGRGVVICGGGSKYFTCAWVAICMLRKFGCMLPVELWHLGHMNPGDPEMCEHMEDLMVPLGVKCVDANKLRKKYPGTKVDSWEHCPGWQLNPFSIIHSSFEEVFFLDADNVVTCNPEYMFETEQYKETGAIFWPDYLRLAPDREIWKIMGVTYRDEEEFESGQIFINKRKCWNALELTMHLNEWSSYYYQHIHGDKDTYHMAWRKLGQEYSMIPHPIHNIANMVMCQHDFDGRIIFQHRNLAKWALNVKMNKSLSRDGFQYETNCLRYLSMLSHLWNGVVENPVPLSDKAMELYYQVINQERYMYVRIGHDRRPMQLMENGKIGDGARRLETDWDIIEEKNGDLKLNIRGQNGIQCSLTLGDKGIFTGKWLTHERMPIELIPMKKAK
jgi:hypothetical protein